MSDSVLCMICGSKAHNELDYNVISSEIQF